MLVLTRKTQQQIRFGSDIVVTVLQVSGDRVRIGIEAPRSVRVIRGELAATPPPEKTAAREKTAVAETAALPSPRRQPAGESSGLFPRLRQRAGALERAPVHTQHPHTVRSRPLAVMPS